MTDTPTAKAPPPGIHGTWATTGDMRLLAWENAAELTGIINEALNTYLLDADLGPGRDLDEYAMELVTDNPEVLGQRGRRLDTPRDDGKVAHVYTYRQTLAMAELLADMLPAIAADAHQARLDYEERLRDAGVLVALPPPAGT